eukprot:gnl/TRDRNA2_/TRDRNA2_93679_c0_seq1.p1 gnl/TRDRNA2_/TRDRNA2_93679_c0~~gnl/TRDRNA2_/TRDRNA2_93679_c0_seq1.p1  ORF type:complete len:232 (-),score=66.71 gnl/TRDRNA2_/TRDRNA2_93679_c0_seq1:140-742(-)
MGASTGTGSGMAGLSLPKAPQKVEIDPRVQQLCDRFLIDASYCKKLQIVMNTRGGTFDDDIMKLTEDMSKAKDKPLHVLLVKMRELERGTFVGKDEEDPDVAAFADKYGLDDRVKHRLMATMKKRMKTKAADLADMDERLVSAKRPAGLLVRLLEGLEEKGNLPSPPRFLGIGKPRHRDRDDEKDRADNDRKRSRSRGRR